MTMTTDDRDVVVVGGVGLVPFEVLRWLRAAERLGVRFRVVEDRLEHDPRLPSVAQAFVEEHADTLRRLVQVVPPRVM
jgi:hypothetical protein